jgi:hypothetical protein
VNPPGEKFSGAAIAAAATAYSISGGSNATRKRRLLNTA